MKDNSIKISVVIPTLNRGALLREAILSVINQTYKVYEIIVVDDGSKENITEAICDLDAPLKLIRHETNRGHSAARNTGIKEASGELIAFLDSDDLWLPNKLEIQLPYFENCERTGLVGGGYEYIDAKGNVVNLPNLPPEKVKYEDLAIGLFAFSGSSPVALCKRDVFDKVGFFDENLLLLEDWDMWIRISESFEVYNPQKRVAQVRMHDEVRAHRPPGLEMVELTQKTRIALNNRIVKKIIRKKATALSYFHSYNGYKQNGKLFTAVKYLVLSFFEYPFIIHRYKPRIRQMVGEALGRR